MSKFLFDSMLPKYPHFQPYISSQLSSSVASTLNLSHSQASIHANSHANSALTTSTSEGSPLSSSEGSPSSPPTSTSRMFPYVTNHGPSHSSLSGMPGYSSLEDKTQCRFVLLLFSPSPGRSAATHSRADESAVSYGPGTPQRSARPIVSPQINSLYRTKLKPKELYATIFIKWNVFLSSRERNLLYFFSLCHLYFDYLWHLVCFVRCPQLSTVYISFAPFAAEVARIPTDGAADQMNGQRSSPFEWKHKRWVESAWRTFR